MSSKKKARSDALEDEEMEDIDAAQKTDRPATASKDNASLPWVEKYRPQTFSEITSHTDIIKTISQFIEEKRIPHFLFYGPPGTGKTTTILAIARKLYGPNYQSMILELNASDERGIDVVRDQIKEFAGTRQIFNTGPKLIVLDEADQMTSAAQAALRRVIEKYSKNTRFCLICNYVSKIIPALQSRCTRFRFAPLPQNDEEKRLKFVIAAEKVNCTEDGVKAIMRLAGGDMRKCLNVLQATSMAYPVVDDTHVYLCTGNPLPADILTIFNAMLNHSFAEAHAEAQKMKAEKGLALSDIIREVHLYVIRAKNLADNLRLPLVIRLAELENNMACGANERLQLTGLIAAFQACRSLE